MDVSAAAAAKSNRGETAVVTSADAAGAAVTPTSTAFRQRPRTPAGSCREGDSSSVRSLRTPQTVRTDARTAVRMKKRYSVATPGARRNHPPPVRSCARISKIAPVSYRSVRSSRPRPPAQIRLHAPHVGTPVTALRSVESIHSTVGSSANQTARLDNDTPSASVGATTAPTPATPVTVAAATARARNVVGVREQGNKVTNTPSTNSVRRRLTFRPPQQQQQQQQQDEEINGKDDNDVHPKRTQNQARPIASVVTSRQRVTARTNANVKTITSIAGNGSGGTRRQLNITLATDRETTQPRKRRPGAGLLQSRLMSLTDTVSAMGTGCGVGVSSGNVHEAALLLRPLFQPRVGSTTSVPDVAVNHGTFNSFATRGASPLAMHVAELVQIVNMNEVGREGGQEHENQKGDAKEQDQCAKRQLRVCDARFLVLAPDAIVQNVTDSEDNEHLAVDGMMKMKRCYVGTDTRSDDEDDGVTDTAGKEGNQLSIVVKDNDVDNKSPSSTSSVSPSNVLMMIPKPWCLMKTDNRTAEALDVQWIIVPFRVLLFNTLQLSSSSLPSLANNKLSSFLVMHEDLVEQTLPYMITNTNVEAYPVK